MALPNPSQPTTEQETTSILGKLLKGYRRLQWMIPGYEGGLTVRNFTGATAAQGLATLSTSDQPISQEQTHNYLTDINIWSRGSVSTAGVITPNSTVLNVGPSGGPYVPIAPGETVTLRRKNPTKLFFNVGKSPASTDLVSFFW